jgi:hypothetical protein
MGKGFGEVVVPNSSHYWIELAACEKTVGGALFRGVQLGLGLSASSVEKLPVGLDSGRLTLFMWRNLGEQVSKLAAQYRPLRRVFLNAPD